MTVVDLASWLYSHQAGNKKSYRLVDGHKILLTFNELSSEKRKHWMSQARLAKTQLEVYPRHFKVSEKTGRLIDCTEEDRK